MTRKEAIRMLVRLKERLNFEVTDAQGKMDALNMAIKALEQEPCGDCVSRESAIEVVRSHWEDILHPVNLRIQEELKELPSVKPQEPKTGHWIVEDIHNCHTEFRCSKCSYRHDFNHSFGEPTADYAYCPVCGAKMESEG